MVSALDFHVGGAIAKVRMRKITFAQIVAFSLMVALILAVAASGARQLASSPVLGDFRGVAAVLVGIVLFYAGAVLIFRLFIRAMPLGIGELQRGSREEFAAQVYVLFLLMIFNSLIRSHVLPIPTMRLVYLALGARLGADTYSAGALLDPPLTIIGRNSIIGHDAVVFAHIIERDRFELAPVRIGNDVTIGAHAAVMPGVEIGDGAVVSVGAVVTKGTRIGRGEIWGGVPARRLGLRDDYPPVGTA